MFEPIMPAAPTMVSCRLSEIPYDKCFTLVQSCYPGLTCKKTGDRFRPYSYIYRAATGDPPAVRPGRSSLDLPAVHQRVGDGQFVDILQFVAEADAARDRRNFQPRELPEAVHQVEERRLALRPRSRWRGSPPSPRRGRSVRVSRSIFRSEGEMPCMGEMTPPSTWYNPRYWRVFSTDSTSATCSTTQIVAWSRSPVGADRAHLLVGEVVALRAVADLVAEPVDAFRHFGDRFALHPKDVDGQAQCRTASLRPGASTARRRRPVKVSTFKSISTVLHPSSHPFLPSAMVISHQLSRRSVIVDERPLVQHEEVGRRLVGRTLHGRRERHHDGLRVVEHLAPLAHGEPRS